ncbi:hypothetical protein Anas_13954 [Armadillidium nasatum]|uniref:Uncharacterized protein n=1 Tax=Armadillidium nasatum TaxID=96803 RepID=A0A5N5T9E7_9CRUS|nr:hypothetical protein Anas_13954 [Armadillidium nasatum]
MKLDDGVDTEDSFAVATSSAAMPKLEVLTSLFIFLGEDAVLLYLLPLLLKPKINFASIKKNTFWKPYKRDMQEAFVIHVQIFLAFNITYFGGVFKKWVNTYLYLPYPLIIYPIYITKRDIDFSSFNHLPFLDFILNFFFRIPRMSVTISRKPRETFPNFFEHATICNFAEERPLNIAQILT